MFLPFTNYMIDEGFICSKRIHGATCTHLGSFQVRELNAFLLFRNRNHREINIIFGKFTIIGIQLTCTGVKRAHVFEHRCSAYEYIFLDKYFKTMAKKKQMFE